MNMQTTEPSHIDIQRLAYQFWEDRGRPWGSSEEDWFRAEGELRHHLGPSLRHYLDSSVAPPFSSIAFGPIEQEMSMRVRGNPCSKHSHVALTNESGI